MTVRKWSTADERNADTRNEEVKLDDEFATYQRQVDELNKKRKSEVHKNTSGAPAGHQREEAGRSAQLISRRGSGENKGR